MTERLAFARLAQGVRRIVLLLSPSPGKQGVAAFRYKVLGKTWMFPEPADRNRHSGYMTNPRGHMQHPKRPFTVETRSSRITAAKRDRGPIWANVDLAKAFREIERDLPAEPMTGLETTTDTVSDLFIEEIAVEPMSAVDPPHR